MKVSEFYGKKLKCADGKSGYVISVNGEGAKIVSFTCADENEREFTVNAEGVTCRKDILYASAGKTAANNNCPIRLGRAVFDEQGKLLGKLNEMTVSKSNNILKAKIGKKNYPAEDIICGDVYILKTCKKLKSDVVKDGKVIFKKGTPVTNEILSAAEEAKEYIQTKLKTL